MRLLALFCASLLAVPMASAGGLFLVWCPLGFRYVVEASFWSVRRSLDSESELLARSRICLPICREKALLLSLRHTLLIRSLRILQLYLFLVYGLRLPSALWTFSSRLWFSFSKSWPALCLFVQSSWASTLQSVTSSCLHSPSLCPTVQITTNWASLAVPF